MLHYVHQLVTNFVCLLFDIRQEVYQSFFRWTRLSAAAGKEVDESSETQPKQSMSWKTLLCRADWNRRVDW